MKIFKYYNRREGEATPHDVILCIGKNLEGKDTHNGWHLSVRLPFIVKNIPNYVDPMTFESRSEKCLFCFRSILRRIRGNENYTILHSHAWQPIK